MQLSYLICDVFTETRFGGNPLAVIPDATGLTTDQMQKIAREFNFSESTFVTAAEHGGTRRVRIFTPTTEVPFAGHPNIGTAFCLAQRGDLDAAFDAHGNGAVVFEENAGDVPIAMQRRGDGTLWAQLTSPEMLSVGKPIDVALFAEALSLRPEQICTDSHPPLVASVGLPFVIGELRDRAALEAARSYMPAFDTIHATGIMPDLHVYVRSNDEFDIRARMFAPLDGVPEDPATGSANCALAGLLAHCADASDGDFTWRIAQGVEMGRPSVLSARATLTADAVTETGVGGTCVMFAEGTLTV